MSRLQEIKELDSGLSYDKYKYLEDEHIEWLIQQAEKVERYQKAMDELENGFEDFGKVTGDKRFVYGVRQVKEKYDL